MKFLFFLVALVACVEAAISQPASVPEPTELGSHTRKKAKIAGDLNTATKYAVEPPHPQEKVTIKALPGMTPTLRVITGLSMFGIFSVGICACGLQTLRRFEGKGLHVKEQ